ncbi:MAG: hypothetical protein ACLU9S_23620 [Oscillospiraceae bacterium]
MQPYLMHAQDLRVELGHTLIVRDVTLGIRDRDPDHHRPQRLGQEHLVRGMCRLLTTLRRPGHRWKAGICRN